MQISEDRNIKKLETYMNEIGDYRFKRIISILKTLNILDVVETLGGPTVLTMQGFFEYSKQDIENIIEDIKNSEIRV